MKKNVFLSVVIPVKNEAKNIARCLTAVHRGIRNISGTEIIVVDACSADSTLEQASRFPVKIIRLQAFWRHTSSAGRYLGCLNSTGKYIFFIDADTVLHREFLAKSLDFMEENPPAGGAGGLDREVYVYRDKKVGEEVNTHKRDTRKIAEVEYLGAAALFRRQALEDAGHFNPYLYSQEELDVCQRLRKKGWVLYSLPFAMSVHFTHPPKGMRIFKKQIAANRFTGIGQMLRVSFSSGRALENIWRFRKFVFFFILLAAAGVLAAASVVARDPGILAAVSVIAVVTYLYLAVRKKNFTEAALSCVKWVAVVVYVGKGLLLAPRTPARYPKDVEVIKGGIKDKKL